MKKLIKLILSVILLILICKTNTAQSSFGYTYGFGLYGRYVNPDIESDPFNKSSGAIFPFFAGPKYWIGTQKISVSLESQLVVNLLAIDINKEANEDLEGAQGWGAIEIPLLLKLNFGGISGLTDFGKGFSIGGGMQLTKTNLFENKEKFKNINRKAFNTYIIEFSYGKIREHMNDKSKLQINEFYIRYGFGDNNASIINFGMKLSSNNFIKMM